MNTPIIDLPDLTMDMIGYLYYKGHQVEHYSHSLVHERYCDALSPEGERRARRLVAECQQLEAEGKEVNSTNLFDLWDARDKAH